MHYTHAVCQLNPADTPSPAHQDEHLYESGGRRKWTPSPAETVTRTASRHAQPRPWRRALERALEADLVPGATATTVAVYLDLVARMDYSTGHVRYCLQDVMKRTRLCRKAVAKHIAILRAAGWLAWVEHGSNRNALRPLGLPGYARTATVYAATIPPIFDEAEGNVLAGSGYEARVIGITEEAWACRVVENPSYTPSLRVVKEESQVQVSGGFTTTATRQPDKHTPRTTILGRIVTRRMADAAERAARQVRPLVNWLQTSTLRQVSWVLLDLVGWGWDEQRILTWLSAITHHSRDGHQWRPHRPHRYVAAQLHAEQAMAREAAERQAAAGPSEEFTAAVAELHAHTVEDQAGETLTLDDLDAETLRGLRLEATSTLLAGDGSLVLTAVENLGTTTARRLYGHLVDRALALLGMSDRATVGTAW